ncbi:phosphoribosylamine--glycine ligase [Microvirga sp. W0021]|uniref:Phosphoribosylamine--glycine ligase n=1 Tax=Hohaiivirga grylli TaxID=3133970 RepID=A0ABV0BH82_9HYPH
MNILLIGSGGREHALAWAIQRSAQCDRLFISPGNPGTAQCGENVDLDITNHKAVIIFCRDYQIDLVVIGPEAPLVDGLVDSLNSAHIRAFGPSKIPAQLEGSKAFTKELCTEFNIPTAAYARFEAEERESALAYVRKQGAPIVIKADGLAAGKGVVVAMSLPEAEAAVNDILGGGLGSAGASIVIEEFLDGEEASFFAICDGTTALPFGTAQDHKRVFDGDKGPNTGGMGAYSPAPVLDSALQARVMSEIIMPTVEGMKSRGTPYVGILYAGLMINTDGAPKLIEYNARLGDPECQVLMPRLESDIVTVLAAAANGHLDKVKITWSDKVALTVVLANEGYPGPVEKGSEIKNIEAAEALPDVLVFHAGTALQGDKLVATGGRVLNVTGIGNSVSEAQKNAYAAISKIDWPKGFCRKDIGWRAIAREQK